jgi:hypothetical protein
MEFRIDGCAVDIYFISPHSDDIAFSLGGIVNCLSRSSQVMLNIINVFTISKHIKCNSVLLKIPKKELRSAATKIRRAEDTRFCRKYNINNIDCNLEEIGILEGSVFNAETRKQIAKNRISSFISEGKSSEREVILFFPMAVGEHTINLAEIFYENMYVPFCNLIRSNWG